MQPGGRRVRRTRTRTRRRRRRRKRRRRREGLKGDGIKVRGGMRRAKEEGEKDVNKANENICR